MIIKLSFVGWIATIVCGLFAVILAAVFIISYHRNLDPYLGPKWSEYIDEYGLSCGSSDFKLSLQNPDKITINRKNISPVNFRLQNEAKNRLNGQTFAKLYHTEVAHFSEITEKQGYTAYLVQTCLFADDKYLKTNDDMLGLISNHKFIAYYDEQKQGVITYSFRVSNEGDVPSPFVFILWHNQPIKIVNPRIGSMG